LLTYRLPFKDALAMMDEGGPLGQRMSGRFEVALQELRPGEPLQPARTLRPDAELRALLADRGDVVMLESLAALAPRSLACKAGHSEIVKRELLGLLKSAKTEGRAVVFMLGGKDPEKLAEKVYLRPPFTDHGLRCGYLRIRHAGEKSWAREKPVEDRVLVGLQLP